MTDPFTYLPPAQFRGTPFVEERCRDCVIRRWIGPSSIGFEIAIYDDRSHSETWLHGGEPDFHYRGPGPASVLHAADGTIETEFWVRDGDFCAPSAHDRLAWIAASREGGA